MGQEGKKSVTAIPSLEELQAEWKAQDEKFDKEWAASHALPKGLVVGKLFRLPVGDGYAYYQIEKINKTTVRVKWRPDLDPDEWMDRVLGDGGSFPKKIIEPIIEGEEALYEIFGKKP